MSPTEQIGAIPCGKFIMILLKTHLVRWRNRLKDISNMLQDTQKMIKQFLTDLEANYLYVARVMFAC